MRTRPRILVVEDDKIFVKALCYNLEDAGFSTTVAHDGSEALQLAQKDKFDLVLTDYQMPMLLGIELCRHLFLVDDDYAHTPMILMSAFEDISVAELFDDFDMLVSIFVKPFPVDELIHQIRECLTARPNAASATKFVGSSSATSATLA